MAYSGVPPSGRFLRWLLWRLPVGATRYAIARNMALATEEGRRWMILAAFGVWVWVAWKVAGWTGSQGARQFAAFLTLYWFWRFFANCRRVWAQRRSLKAQAVSLQRQREMYQMQEKALALMQQGVGRLPSPGGTLTTMMGSARHHDPVAEEYRRMAAEQGFKVPDQAAEVRSWLPDEHRDLPLGDRFEPTFRLPRFRRRKKGSDDA
jgi:hypothetical protein